VDCIWISTTCKSVKLWIFVLFCNSQSTQHSRCSKFNQTSGMWGCKVEAFEMFSRTGSVEAVLQVMKLCIPNRLWSAWTHSQRESEWELEIIISKLWCRQLQKCDMLSKLGFVQEWCRQTDHFRWDLKMASHKLILSWIEIKVDEMEFEMQND
jgi:hypothetical protein